MHRLFLLLVVATAIAVPAALPGAAKADFGTCMHGGVFCGWRDNSYSGTRWVSDYTDAQLRALAATPSPPVDDSMSYGLPSHITRTVTMSPAYYACWDDTRQSYHGTWPQEQQVYLNTHWCANASGIIQTRSSYVTMHSTLCSSHDPYNARVGGGVGSSYVDVEGGAYFDCPTGIPWVQTHWHVSVTVRYHGGGGVQVLSRTP